MVVGTILRKPSIGELPNKFTIHKLKTYVVETANTVDATDTIAIDITPAGFEVVLGAIGVAHSTDNSIMVEENPETSVSTTTLTLTVPAGTDDDKRVYVVYGF